MSAGQSYKQFDLQLYESHVVFTFNLQFTRCLSHTAHQLTTRSEQAAATIWFTTHGTNQQTPNDFPIQLSQPLRNNVSTSSATEDKDCSAATHVINAANNLVQSYPSTNQVSDSNLIRSTDLSLRELKQNHLHLRHGANTAIQEYHCSRIDDLFLESTYGKNLIRGSKLASAFELLYAVQPRSLERIDSLMPPPISISTRAAYTACDRVSLMLQEPPREMRTHGIISRPPSYFRRNGEGWLGPSKILKITKHNVILSHNGHTETSAFNRVQQILPDATIYLDPDNGIQMSLHAETVDTVSRNNEPNLTALPRNTQDSDAKSSRYKLMPIRLLKVCSMDRSNTQQDIYLRYQQLLASPMTILYMFNQ